MRRAIPSGAESRKTERGAGERGRDTDGPHTLGRGRGAPCCVVEEEKLRRVGTLILVFASCECPASAPRLCSESQGRCVSGARQEEPPHARVPGLWEERAGAEELVTAAAATWAVEAAVFTRWRPCQHNHLVECKEERTEVEREEERGCYVRRRITTTATSTGDW